jgi:hypothetical protein
MKKLLKRIKCVPVIVAGCLLFSFCHKDKVINNQPIVTEDDPCYPALGHEPLSGWINKSDLPGYGWPDFNPNNNNEFICIEQNQNIVNKLIAYNMISHKKTLLATGSFMYQLKMGQKRLDSFHCLS